MPISDPLTGRGHDRSAARSPPEPSRRRWYAAGSSTRQQACHCTIHRRRVSPPDAQGVARLLEVARDEDPELGLFLRLAVSSVSMRWAWKSLVARRSTSEPQPEGLQTCSFSEEQPGDRARRRARQFHARLRVDDRVSALERTNARELAVCRSRRICAPATCRSSACKMSAAHLALRLAASGWEALVLVKPQFEAGRAEGARRRGDP